MGLPCRTMRRSVLTLLFALAVTTACSAADETPSTTVTTEPGATTAVPGTTTPAAPSTTGAVEGPSAPDFTLALGTGGEFSLSAEEKPVYMVFWAEW
jgi:hypothetical protein